MTLFRQEKVKEYLKDSNDFFWCKKLIYKCATRSNDRNNFIESLLGKEN